jgi:hypothetical protein
VLSDGDPVPPNRGRRRLLPRSRPRIQPAPSLVVMSDDNSDSGDELTWPDALRLIEETFNQVTHGAERLREMADAGDLELCDRAMSSLLEVTHLVLEHDLQGNAPTHYGDKAPIRIRLIRPDDGWGRPTP